MKAIIIGGGIGGLTAAIALETAGIEAHVYERASCLGEVGAGISLWANAINALDQLGLTSSIRPRLLSQVHSDVRTWRGELLSSLASDGLTGGNGVTVGVMHRAELLAALISHLNPGRIHLDHECTGFTQDAMGVEAQFANRKSSNGDLLIGADGLRSVVRSQLFGDIPPRYAGYTGWRAVVDFKRFTLVPCESWGRGRRFGAIPMNDGRVYWYATNNAPERERDAPGKIKQNLMQLFRGWHDSIEALIEAADESAILRNDIYDREPLSRWTENRVTLLGDAAHPMTPNLGQGGCQAIEDAVVLAACLRASTAVESGLLRYQDRRIPRTSRIALTSRRLGEIAQLENPLLCFTRNMVVRATPTWATARQVKSVVSYAPLSEQEQWLLGGRKQQETRRDESKHPV
jgi:2-polyprenyl-6-methoxyphenol hydroxylase-like FAD-dependent oxidoreductase